jgi:hypothetical protein
MDTLINASSSDANAFLECLLAKMPGEIVLRHFMGVPLMAPFGDNLSLNEAAIVCLDFEWWQEEPKPTTEIGTAERVLKDVLPSVHAENILTTIQVAHARIMPNAHLTNTFAGAGNPEGFHFGTTMFVTELEAKKLVLDTFVRPSSYHPNFLKPIILIGHDVQNEVDHINSAFGIDLHQYGTIVKVIDTQVMAHDAGIKSTKGPKISLGDLLTHFNINFGNLHTAGNDAAGTLMAAILIAFQDFLYPNRQYGKPPAIEQGRNIHDVIDRAMQIGKSLPQPSFGRPYYCTRCGCCNHFRTGCIARVVCTLCRDSKVKQLYNNHDTHMTSRCIYNYKPLPNPDYIVPEDEEMLEAPGMPEDD